MIKKDVKKHDILPHEIFYFIFIADPLSSSLAHYCISLNVYLVTKIKMKLYLNRKYFIKHNIS